LSELILSTNHRFEEVYIYDSKTLDMFKNLCHQIKINDNICENVFYYAYNALTLYETKKNYQVFDNFVNTCMQSFSHSETKQNKTDSDNHTIAAKDTLHKEQTTLEDLMMQLKRSIEIANIADCTKAFNKLATVNSNIPIKSKSSSTISNLIYGVFLLILTIYMF
ncbi:hypothetical protein HEP_00373500, partial [Hepatocystis sp. ex Piliocolobus tephrosceles]